MASQAQTYTILTTLQSFLDANLTVSGVSPFSAFNTADAALYGVTHAVYPHMPIAVNVAYPRQCHLVPVHDDVRRHAYGGKVWDEIMVHVNFVFLGNQVGVSNAWLNAFKDLCNARDAAHVLFAQHAQLPGLPIVIASKLEMKASAPTGYFIDQYIGRDWECWGFTWWFRSEYNVGPIVS